MERCLMPGWIYCSVREGQLTLNKVWYYRRRGPPPISLFTCIVRRLNFSSKIKLDIDAVGRILRFRGKERKFGHVIDCIGSTFDVRYVSANVSYGLKGGLEYYDSYRGCIWRGRTARVRPRTSPPTSPTASRGAWSTTTTAAAFWQGTTPCVDRGESVNRDNQADGHIGYRGCNWRD